MDFNDKIRNFPVENIATSTDIQVKKFQECDDYFVPGFNIDKAYVGHLIYYVLSMINNTDVLSVYTKMKALNKKLKLEKAHLRVGLFLCSQISPAR